MARRSVSRVLYSVLRVKGSVSLAIGSASGIQGRFLCVIGSVSLDYRECFPSYRNCFLGSRWCSLCYRKWFPGYRKSFPISRQFSLDYRERFLCFGHCSLSYRK